LLVALTAPRTFQDQTTKSSKQFIIRKRKIERQTKPSYQTTIG